MAVDMKPTRSALATPRAGSLLMRPTQVASVNDVEEPENTLASVTAVAPTVAAQEEPVVTPQEPQATVEPTVPEVTEEPVVEPEPTFDVPERTQGIAIADEETSRAVMESIVAGKEQALTGDNVVDPATIEIDYEHPWFKEELSRRAEAKKQRAIEGLNAVGNSTGRSAEDLRKEAAKYETPAVEFTAEDEYEALENRSRRTLFGFIETPRYLASIPGLTARLLEDETKDSDSTLVKRAASAYASLTSAMMDSVFSRITSMPVGFTKESLYDTAIVNPVVKGFTIDQQFENDLLRDIKKRTGVTLDPEYLTERAYIEAAQEGAATFGVLGLLRGAMSGAKVGAGRLAATAVSEGTKGAASSAASVWGSNQAIELIDPKSKEGQILAGMLGGAVTAPVAAAALDTTGKAAKYSPSAIAIRGSKVLLDKAAGIVADTKRDSAIGKIMRVEGTDRKEAIRRYYTRLDNESPERKNMALRLLNDTEMTNEERMDAVNQIIDIALKDPLSREAEVVRTSIAVMERDKSTIEGAWSQAELLNKAFEDSQFKADVFDVYNGKYTDSFMKLREAVAPEEVLGKQKAMLDFLRDQLQRNTDLSEIERGEMVAAAKLLEKNMDEEIASQMTLMQQNVAAALDTVTEQRFTDVVPLDANVSRVRESLVEVKKQAKELLKVGYASIDPQNKVRSKSAFTNINDFVSSLDSSNTAYKGIQKAFSSLMSDATARYRDTTDDASIIAGTKTNPTSFFSPSALRKADEVVYLNPKQFEQLTGVTLNPKKGEMKKPLSTLASIELEADADGSFVVKGTKGAEVYGPLGRDTLIPVSMNYDLLKGLADSRLRIKDPSGAVVQLDLTRQLRKTGDDRHNIALLDHTVDEGRRRGNLSPETPQASFLPKFDIEKIELTYKEMDQFQRSIRRLRKEAWNREDNDAYLTLKEFDHQLNEMIQGALKDSPEAYNQRKAMDKLYGDSFIPEFEDRASLIGRATTQNPNRTYAYAMSSLLDNLGSKVELRQQLNEVLNPDTSKFIRGITGTRATTQLDKLMGMDKATLRKFEVEGKNVASAMLDIKMTDILQSVYKNIGTDKDPRDFLINQMKGLQDSPDFNALYMASEGTDTHTMVTRALSLADDADLNEVLNMMQTHIDKFDDIFYKSVRGMKDPANTKAILDIVSNLDKIDELEADLVRTGELSAAAPHMIKVVLSDILKMGDKGFSVATIQNGINKYGDGLRRMPGGTEVLRTLEEFKNNQGMLDRLTKSVGKKELSMSVQTEATGTERRLGYLPSIFSDIKAARKGIVGMDYAVFASITGIATKEMKALRKVEGKASSEVFAAALMNKELFDKLNTVGRALGEAETPSDKLRGISLVVHSANGTRLGALEAVAGLIEQADDTEALLEALRATPEYQEVEQEEAAALEQQPQGEPEDVLYNPELDDELSRMAAMEGPFDPNETEDSIATKEAISRLKVFKDKGMSKEEALKVIKGLNLAENENLERILSALDKVYASKD